MVMRKPMTPTERMLFKEAIIRGYRAKHEEEVKRNVPINRFFRRLKKAAPINIFIGVAACILLVILEGWDRLVYILLFSVIWITLISTILSAFVETK